MRKKKNGKPRYESKRRKKRWATPKKLYEKAEEPVREDRRLGV